MPLSKNKKKYSEVTSDGINILKPNQNEKQILRSGSCKNLGLSGSLNQILNLNTSKVFDKLKKEQAYKKFWESLNDEYFYDISEEDTSKLKEIIENIEKPLKKTQNKYPNYHAYHSIKNVLSEENIYNQNHDKRINKLNLINIKKHFRLAAYNNNNKTLSVSIYKKKKIESKKDKVNQEIKLLYAKNNGKTYKSNNLHQILTLLENENKILDSAIIELNDNTHNTQSDELAYELEKMVNDHQSLKNKISNMINGLIKQCDMSYGNKLQKLNVLNLDNDEKQILRKYLENTIIQMENKQLGESIKYILDIKISNIQGRKSQNIIILLPLKSKNEFIESNKYFIAFDDALKRPHVWVDETTLDILDKIRENSLFSIYRIAAQKVPRSVASHNIIGHRICTEIMEGKKFEINKGDLKPIIHQIYSKNIKDLNKQNLVEDIENFHICHYCKQLFPEKILIKCKNDGIVRCQLYQNEKESKIVFPYNLKSNTNKQRSAANHKGCLRFFCRYCLKQVYDANIQEVIINLDWACPFCNNSCYCTRCVRDHDLEKHKKLYKEINGNLEKLKKSSLYEQLIATKDYDDKYLKTEKLGIELVSKKRGRKPNMKKLIPTESKSQISFIEFIHHGRKNNHMDFLINSIKNPDVKKEFNSNKDDQKQTSNLGKRKQEVLKIEYESNPNSASFEEEPSIRKKIKVVANENDKTSIINSDKKVLSSSFLNNNNNNNLKNEKILKLYPTPNRQSKAKFQSSIYNNIMNPNEPDDYKRGISRRKIQKQKLKNELKKIRKDSKLGVYWGNIIKPKFLKSRISSLNSRRPKSAHVNLSPV